MNGDDTQAQNSNVVDGGVPAGTNPVAPQATVEAVETPVTPVEPAAPVVSEQPVSAEPAPQAQPVFGPQPQQFSQPGMQQPVAAPVQGGKSSTVAGLLGIFLGTVGAHNFYLGQKKLGFIHVGLVGGSILLTIISTIVAASQTTVQGLLSGGFGASFGATVILGTISTLVICASGIWGLIEGIMCLTKSGKYGQDANGVPTV